MSLISILKKNINKTLFTTPSHGGNFCLYHKFYQWYKSDISEIDALDPETELIKAEEQASKVYGTKYTKFLTNGSSSGIISAVLTCAKNKRVLIWENSHPCHKNSAKLAGAEILVYKFPKDEELGIYKAITPDELKKIIQEQNADAIIITTPTYEGFVADIKSISEICKKHNIKLIADEAHGALYPFSEELPTSAAKYADYTIQSLHKTAGGLNPTALLHSNDLDPTESLKMISTTSPSYPMLATIEANINFLNSAKGKKKINELINNIKKLGINQLNDDITKILLKKEGLSGYEISENLFDRFSIEDERTNEKTTMLLCGIGTTDKMLKRLKNALTKLDIK